MSSHIFIASTKADRPNIRPVSDALKKRGFKVIEYEADQVIDGLAKLTVTLGASKGLKIIYEGVDVTGDNIKAAWYRRPSQFTQKTDDIGLHKSLAAEYRDLQKIIWRSIPEPLWLNSPDAINLAQEKLSQLLAAQEIGFTIPETLVSNDWREVRSMGSEQILLKMPNGDLATKDGLRTMYAVKFKNDPEHLPLNTQPYPGIWQAYAPKKREWRVTVVGESVFAAAIYTTSKAAGVDWRSRQFDASQVKYVAEDFPESEATMCKRLLRKLGLKFGAFDFVETPDGQIVFLEVNPNGQYGWIEHELNMPISQAIADTLAEIADRS